MNTTPNNIATESASIRDHNLLPVARIRFGSPTPMTPALCDTISSTITDSNANLIIVDANETSAIPNQYAANTYTSLLKDACDCCHASGISCTNGGIEDNFIIPYYLTTTDDPKLRQKTLDSLTPEQLALVDPKKNSASVELVRTLLTEYATSPIDFINITWRNYPEQLFGNIVQHVQKEFGKKVITTEIHIPENPEIQKRYLRYVQNIRLEYVIWYFPSGTVHLSDIYDETGNLTKAAQTIRAVNRKFA